MLLPLSGLSYRKCAWVPQSLIEAKRSGLLRSFLNKHMQAEGDMGCSAAAEHGVEPEWLQV